MRFITISLSVLIILSACTGTNQVESDTTSEDIVQDESSEMAQTVEEDADTFASEPDAETTDGEANGDNTSESPAESPTIVPTNTPEPTAVACNYRTGWEIYRIRGGDTIWELAEATDTTVEVLMEANCQTDHVLTIGQYFRLPVLPETDD